MRQHRQAHSRMKLGVFGIDADSIEFLEAVMSEISEVRKPLEKFRVFGQYCPTFDGMENLGCVETTGADITIFEDGPTVDFHPKRMSPIINHFQPVSIGDLLDLFHFTGNAIDVCGENGGCLGRNRCFDQVWVDGQRVRENIHKDRLASLPDDAGRSGYIGKGGGDDFSSEVQGFDSKLKGDGAIGHIEQVIDAQVIFQSQLEFVDQWAVVG